VNLETASALIAGLKVDVGLSLEHLIDVKLLGNVNDLLGVIRRLSARVDINHPGVLKNKPVRSILDERYNLESLDRQDVARFSLD